MLLKGGGANDVGRPGPCAHPVQAPNMTARSVREPWPVRLERLMNAF